MAEASARDAETSGRPRRLRILAVGNMYPPHHLGGYELVWQGAMQRARAEGHEVRVLTSDHRESAVSAEDDPGVHRELEWYWSWAEHDWPDRGPLERLGVERRNAATFGRHLAEFEPDVVSFWAMGSMSLSLIERAARRGPPSVLVVHDDWLVYGPQHDLWMRMWGARRWRRAAAGAAGPLLRIPTRFRRRRPERVLANSEFILGRARERGYELPDASVISPGVGEAFLRPAPEPPWEWRLACVGRLDSQKGTDLALEALARLPEAATLTIAGSGDPGYERELRDRAGALGCADQVRFAGQVGGDALPELYAGADAVIFPVRWEEPFGLVPLEAMGIGRPVVATARGGAAEYLRDGRNCLAVPVDDAEAIAAAVTRLAGDEALRSRLREGGLATAAARGAERFEQRVVEELERAALAEGATGRRR